MILPLPGLPWFRIGASAVLVVALLTGVHHIRRAFDERDHLASQVEALNEQAQLIKRANAATVDALRKRTEDRVRIVTVTKEIAREIPQYIPAGSPELPGGFRVLHDAAAAGVLPSPTGGADAPSVSPQALAETLLDNYGTCHDTASQLERLQQWITSTHSRQMP